MERMKMNRFNIKTGDTVLNNGTMLIITGFCDYSDKHVYAKSDDGEIALVMKSRLKLVKRGNNP